MSADEPVNRELVETMFANIARETTWDLTQPMLWGYFFTNPEAEPLHPAAERLAKLGYRLVEIYPDSADPPAQWWLHVERVEVHSIETLMTRNRELALLAEELGLSAYDGMDVGPVDAHREAEK